MKIFRALRVWLIVAAISWAPCALPIPLLVDRAVAAEAIKVLGQSNPSATTATTLYTVPASTSTVVSSIIIANQAATTATFRISVRQAGATQTAAMYIAYDVTVPANDSIVLTVGLTLATTDVITVYGSSATLSFAAFGSEIS